MKILNIQSSVKFSTNVKIRRFANEIEDEFAEDNFDAPQILPFPDNLEPEAPRIILSSANEDIIFSQISVDFIIRNRQQLSFDECVERIVKRITSIATLLRKISIHEYYYSGIQIQCIREKLKDDPVLILSSEMNRDISDPSEQQSIYNLAHEETRTVDETYFVNKRSSILRDLDLKISQDTVPASLRKPLDDRKKIEGILSIIDVNDRYAYMYNNQVVDIDDLPNKTADIIKIVKNEFESMEKKDV